MDCTVGLLLTSPRLSLIQLTMRGNPTGPWWVTMNTGPNSMLHLNSTSQSQAWISPCSGMKSVHLHKQKMDARKQQVYRRSHIPYWENPRANLSGRAAVRSSRQSSGLVREHTGSNPRSPKAMLRVTFGKSHCHFACFPTFLYLPRLFTFTFFGVGIASYYVQCIVWWGSDLSWSLQTLPRYKC